MKVFGNTKRYFIAGTSSILPQRQCDLIQFPILVSVVPAIQSAQESVINRGFIDKIT
jgi:hypothetical protein